MVGNLSSSKCGPGPAWTARLRDYDTGSLTMDIYVTRRFRTVRLYRHGVSMMFGNNHDSTFLMFEFQPIDLGASSLDGYFKMANWACYVRPLLNRTRGTAMVLICPTDDPNIGPLSTQDTLTFLDKCLPWGQQAR